METIRNRHIVFTGLQPWDISIGSNSKNIAVEMAKNNTVLYVNPPADRFSAIKSGLRTFLTKSSEPARAYLEEVHPSLWVLRPRTVLHSISRLGYNRLFDRLNRLNNQLLAHEIRSAMQRLGMSEHIHFCDSDILRSYHLKELLKPNVYIYYSRDNLAAVPYWQVQGARVEPMHIAKADLVFANSQFLRENAAAYNPDSIFVGQGCEFADYAGIRQRPDELRQLSGPVIGYAGALSSLRLDIGLIAELAEARPGWNFVLVGPEDSQFRESRLHRLPNILFTGSKQQDELPAYIQHFDLAINPQLVNDVTRGNYPRKIDEYLAAGRPVVATRTPAMDYFAPYAQLAGTSGEWLSTMEYELTHDTPAQQQERSAYARTHSWENCVNIMYPHIAQKLQP